MHTGGLKSLAGYVVRTTRIRSISGRGSHFGKPLSLWALSTLPPVARDRVTQRGNALQVRYMWRSRSSQSIPLSSEEEEAGRAAILQKVMNGRQPTDLMLRCEHDSKHELQSILSLTPRSGTVLDAEGASDAGFSCALETNNML